MTIKVNFIEGRKGSACNNNAFGVTALINGKRSLLDIVPAEGLSASEIKEKFENAILNLAPIDVEKVINTARQELGLQTIRLS